jgi:DNA-binding SARP family transcriptional activator
LGHHERVETIITEAVNDPELSIRRINLLGGVQVEGVPITGEKAAGLVAYLALNIQSRHPREVLIDLLWPDFSPDRGRRALSDILYRLRKSLGADYLIADAGRVGLNPVTVWTDVGEFLKLANSADMTDRRKAIQLYTGPLAPEVYMDWLLSRRVMIHDRYLSTLEQLAEYLESQGQADEALFYFQQLAEANPLREEAQRGVMRNLARTGRFAEALAAYSRLAILFHNELNVAPAEDTQILAEEIRTELSGQQNRSPVLTRPPCVGRTKERALALAMVESAINGTAALLAIEGLAGIGKSRLWEEIAAGARWRGATVIVARAREHPTVAPLEPLSEILAQALQGPRRAQVELLLPSEILAAVADLYPPWRDRPPLPELPPAQARHRLEIGLAEIFRTLTELAPHVIVFDDLHWAAPALWDAIAALLKGPAHQRLLIGLAYRRPDMETNEGWPLLQQWERDGLLAIATLAPLSTAEIAAALPVEYRANADTVVAASGGNPFYLTQALIALQEGTPLLIAEGIVRHRLQALPAADRDALETASTLGMQVRLGLWVALTDLAPVSLIAVAGRLVEHYFLEPVEEGYAFPHDLVQAGIYEQIEPERRRELHARVAQAWRESEPDNVHALAFHFDRAGHAQEAATYYRAAGIRNLQAYAFAEALTAFERALQLWPAAPEPERILTLFDVAQVGDSIGDRVRQRSALEEALQHARQLENDAFMLRALIGLGRLAAVTGEVDLAARHLKSAVKLAQQVPDGNLGFEAHFYTGDLEARRGQLDSSGTQFELALDSARIQNNPLNEARALRGLSIVARLSGDLVKAMRLIDQALAMQLANGDLFGASVTQTNQLAAYYDMGAWDWVIALADEALDLKLRLGDQHGAAILNHMKGLAAYSLGDLPQARESLATGLQGFETVQDRRTAGLAHNVMGLVAEAAGDLPRAEREYVAALSSAEAVGAATEAAYAHHDLGALLVSVNRLEEAIPHLEKARDTWQNLNNNFLRLKSEAYLGLALMAADRQRAAVLANAGWAAFQGGIPSGEMPQAWLWGLYRLLVDLERPQEAAAIIEAAYAELQRQAVAIQDLLQRRHFFQRVSLNREIVIAFDKLRNTTRQITLHIARADVPIGRRLTPADFMPITWTILAPDDELIADPAERRQNSLRRLLDEAVAQGVAPTDDDLAAALGVSRRTIVRDMQTLAQSGQRIPTRKRK